MRNCTEIVPRQPLRRGVKRKRGSKIERCHVRVSHLLVSFLFENWDMMFAMFWRRTDSCHIQKHVVGLHRHYKHTKCIQSSLYFAKQQATRLLIYLTIAVQVSWTNSNLFVYDSTSTFIPFTLNPVDVARFTNLYNNRFLLLAPGKFLYKLSITFLLFIASWLRDLLRHRTIEMHRQQCELITNSLRRRDVLSTW